MSPLAIAILAAAVGLTVLALGVALVARARARRRRLRLERGLREDRLIWDRLDWVAGIERAIPELAATLGAAAPTDQELEGSGPTSPSPRLRLWRDTSAVLFVCVLGLLAFSLVTTPNPSPEGGVLAVTSSPPTLPRTPAPGIPSATPAATPAPTQAANPSTLLTPGAASTLG